MKWGIAEMKFREHTSGGKNLQEILPQGFLYLILLSKDFERKAGYFSLKYHSFSLFSYLLLYKIYHSVK